MRREEKQYHIDKYQNMSQSELYQAANNLRLKQILGKKSNNLGQTEIKEELAFILSKLAGDFFQKTEYEKSLLLYEEVLQLKHDIQDKSGANFAKFSIANTYYGLYVERGELLQHIEQAYQYIHKAESAKYLPTRKIITIAYQKKLAKLAVEAVGLGKIDDAITLNQTSYQLCLEIDDRLSAAYCCDRLASIYSALHNENQGEENVLNPNGPLFYIEQALLWAMQSCVEEKQFQGLVTALRPANREQFYYHVNTNYADALNSMGEFELAIRYYQMSIEYYQMQGVVALPQLEHCYYNQLQAFQSIANSKFGNNNLYTNSVDTRYFLLQIAYFVARAGFTQTQSISILKQWILITYRFAHIIDMNDAISLLFENMKRIELHPDNNFRRIAVAFHNDKLGRLYFYQGNFKEAEYFFRQANKSYSMLMMKPILVRQLQIINQFLGKMQTSETLDNSGSLTVSAQQRVCPSEAMIPLIDEFLRPYKEQARLKRQQTNPVSTGGQLNYGSLWEERAKKRQRITNEQNDLSSMRPGEELNL